jgi:hypothetical protein
VIAGTRVVPADDDSLPRGDKPDLPATVRRRAAPAFLSLRRSAARRRRFVISLQPVVAVEGRWGSGRHGSFSLDDGRCRPATVRCFAATARISERRVVAGRQLCGTPRRPSVLPASRAVACGSRALQGSAGPLPGETGRNLPVTKRRIGIQSVVGMPRPIADRERGVAALGEIAFPGEKASSLERGSARAGTKGCLPAPSRDEAARIVAERREGETGRWRCGLPGHGPARPRPEAGRRAVKPRLSRPVSPTAAMTLCAPRRTNGCHLPALPVG